MSVHAHPPTTALRGRTSPSATVGRLLSTGSSAALAAVLLMLVGGFTSAWPAPALSTAAASPTPLGGPDRGSVPSSAAAHVPIRSATANNSSCTWSGLNHWVNVTSGSSQGPAPLTLSWEVIVQGGTRPYNITNIPGDGSREFGANVTHSFVRPGYYEIQIWIVDSSTPCLAAGTGFEVYAWGPGGPNPAHFNRSTAGGPAPLVVRYSINVTGLPSNATINWTCFDGNGYGFWSRTNGLTTTCTYFFNGSGRVEVYIYYPDGGIFWYGWGPSANITGPSLLSMAVTPISGVGSVNVTGWINSTNSSRLPPGYSFAGGLYPNPAAPCASFSVVNITPRLSQPFKLGPLVYPSGCTSWWETWDGSMNYLIQVALLDGNGSSVAMMGAQVTVAPTPAEHRSPVVSFTITPDNGTAPLNVTFQTSAVGGTPPYQLQVATVTQGPPNATGNRSLIYSYFVNQSGWTGAPSSAPQSYPAGDHRVVAIVTDANGNATLAWGEVSAYSPPGGPPLAAAAQVQNVGAPPSLSATFQANISGGTPPYSIEWTFGDGAVGSSRNAAPVTHPYSHSGTFVVGFSARDSAGHTVAKTLTVVIPGLVRPASRPAGGAQPMNAAVFVGATAVVGAAIAGGGWWLHRRRLADGSALVRALVAESNRRSGPPPTGR